MCEANQNIIIPSAMEKLESVQYTAALAVTGTWRRTSRHKLYAELGWETLSARRWSRRLILFYKIINNFTPLYTRNPLPPLHQSQYSLRRQEAVGLIVTRTEKLKSSFYPNSIFEWNKVDPETSLLQFLRKRSYPKFVHLQTLFLGFMTHSTHLIFRS